RTSAAVSPAPQLRHFDMTAIVSNLRTWRAAPVVRTDEDRWRPWARPTAVPYRRAPDARRPCVRTLPRRPRRRRGCEHSCNRRAAPGRAVALVGPGPRPLPGVAGARAGSTGAGYRGPRRPQRAGPAAGDDAAGT